MKKNPKEWPFDEHYKNGKRILGHIKVVNDTAERSVKLAKDFKNILTTNEEQQQYVFQCVQAHRQAFSNTNKDTLKHNVLM